MKFRKVALFVLGLILFFLCFIQLGAVVRQH